MDLSDCRRKRKERGRVRKTERMIKKAMVSNERGGPA
jgi:hypothetical protein